MLILAETRVSACLAPKASVFLLKHNHLSQLYNAKKELQTFVLRSSYDSSAGSSRKLFEGCIQPQHRLFAQQ